MVIVFLGPPGVGKGTQGRRLAAQLSATYISTGEILRQAAQDGTPFGRQVASTLRDGRLVGDDVIVALLLERLERPDATQRFLLDGFPRTIQQAEALDDFLAQQEIELTTVLQLSADSEELRRRLVSRAAAEGRSDDTPETISQRLAIYRHQTEPLIEYYEASGKLRRIDGMGTPNEVYQRICEALPGGSVDPN